MILEEVGEQQRVFEFGADGVDHVLHLGEALSGTLEGSCERVEDGIVDDAVHDVLVG